MFYKLCWSQPGGCVGRNWAVVSVATEWLRWSQQGGCVGRNKVVVLVATERSS